MKIPSLTFRRRGKEPERLPTVPEGVTTAPHDGRLHAYAAHRHLLATGSHKKADKANDGVWAYYLLKPVQWNHTSAEHRARVITTFAHAEADV